MMIKLVFGATLLGGIVYFLAFGNPISTSKTKIEDKEKEFVLNDAKGLYYLTRDSETQNLSLEYLSNFGVCEGTSCPYGIRATVVDLHNIEKPDDLVGTFVKAEGKVSKNEDSNEWLVKLKALTKDDGPWTTPTEELSSLLTSGIAKIEYAPDCSTGCHVSIKDSWDKNLYTNVKDSSWGLNKDLYFECPVTNEVVGKANELLQKAIENPTQFKPFKINQNYEQSKKLLDEYVTLSNGRIYLTLNNAKKYTMLYTSFGDLITFQENTSGNPIATVKLRDLNFIEGKEFEEYISSLIQKEKEVCATVPEQNPENPAPKTYSNYYMGYSIKVPGDWKVRSVYPNDEYNDGQKVDLATTPTIYLSSPDYKYTLDLKEELMYSGKSFEENAHRWRDYYMGSSSAFGGTSKHEVEKEEQVDISGKTCLRDIISYTLEDGTTTGTAIWIYVPIDEKHLLSIKYSADDSEKHELEKIEEILSTIRF